MPVHTAIIFSWILFGIIGGSCLLSFLDRHRNRAVEYEALTASSHARAMVIFFGAMLGYVMFPLVLGEIIYWMMFRDAEKEWNEFED